MAEAYFQFKKFRVYHHSCGFKVGTDGVLLGAWAPVKNGDRVLDIGTGSGLISMMLAQRADVSTDALDINPAAAELAAMNFARSPFSDLRAFSSSIADWKDRVAMYDLVICNPPFFSNASKPKSASLKIAKHCVSLCPMGLFSNVKRLLKDDGRFAIVFPVSECDNFWKAAKAYGFYAKEVMDIYPLPDHDEIRMLVNFVLNKIEQPVRTALTIEKGTAHRTYSDAYKQLTKDFYLHF